VLPESAELSVTLKMSNDFSNLIYTETDRGQLTIRNMSTARTI